MKILYKNQTAETLIEVIIAIFIVVIGSGAATTLIVSSIIANTYSKDNLVALNLAVEGIEAVRNIRDTNWIKFGYDKENCWDMKPQSTSADSCTDPNNKIKVSNYTVDLDPVTHQWDLSAQPTSLDLKGGTTLANEPFRLKYVDVTAGNTDGKGNATDDPDMYVSDAVWSGYANPAGDSKFYRMVTITPAGAPTDTLTVVSLVQWRNGRTVYQVKLSSILTNFNKVKETP